jgi:hypothetical protein
MTYVIVSPAGRALPWSNEDALWLARAVEAEGSPETLVAQTLVNRWAWLADANPGAYPTLTSLVRAYAQPVNPGWFREGHLFLAWLAAHPELTPEQVARERSRADVRQYTHSTRDVFTPPTNLAVNRALRGPLSLPRGALHFGQPNNPELVPLVRGPGNWIYEGREAPGARYSVAEEGPHFMPARMLDGGHWARSAVFTAAVLGTVWAMRQRR